MASLWQRTLFYLGLVDDEQMEAAEEASVRQTATPSVRTTRPRPQTVRPQGVQQQQQPAAAQPPSVTRGVAGRRLEPPEASRRRVSSNPRLAEAGVYVHEGSAAVSAAPQPNEAIVIEARTFSDAQSLADHIRGSSPVVLDLRSTEPSMVRRLVDFSTGLTYALDGRMAKIGRGVILVTPQGVNVGADEQQRLAGLGLYETPKA